MESPNERSQPASQLRRQWAQQDQQLPLTSAPAPAPELKEEEEVKSDSGNHAASGKALCSGVCLSVLLKAVGGCGEVL